jgi:hypothetical protein
MGTQKVDQKEQYWDEASVARKVEMLARNSGDTLVDGWVECSEER